MKVLWRVPLACVLTVLGCTLAMLSDSTEDLYRPDAYRARVENQRRVLRELWAWVWGNTETHDSRSAS